MTALRDARSRARPRARLAVVAGATLWGTTGTAQALGPDAATPAVVGALRIVLGAAALAAAVAVGRRARGVVPFSWTSADHRAATLAGMAAIAAYQVCFFAGVARAGVAVGTLVGIGSAPVVTGLLGLVVRRERPEPGWGAATALAIAGAGLLVAGGAPGPRPSTRSASSSPSRPAPPTPPTSSPARRSSTVVPPRRRRWPSCSAAGP